MWLKVVLKLDENAFEFRFFCILESGLTRIFDTVLAMFSERNRPTARTTAHDLSVDFAAKSHFL